MRLIATFPDGTKMYDCGDYVLTVPPKGQSTTWTKDEIAQSYPYLKGSLGKS